MESPFPQDLQTKIDEWLKWDPNPRTKAEIEKLVEEKNAQELRARLLKRISFGTAGLRGRMCAGFINMNDVTVIQASQGLCRYLEEKVPDIKEKGVVVGHDHRHNSRRFGELTAAAFLSQGIKVYLLGRERKVVVPTPFVPVGVALKHAAAGIMITASHNPKEDNGYKVYWDNACQIIEPHDKGIAAAIEKNLAPWEESADVEGLLNRSAASGLLIDNLEEVAEYYYTTIRQKYSFLADENAKSNLKIVYTAMHGVGGVWTKKAFQAFNLPDFIEVREQIEPDPDFPTVAFPNPEEGKGALKLAMATADAAGATLIFANDPDADRLAVAEKLPTGEWKIFDGNQIGILLADWVWHKFRATHPEIEPGKCVMLNTTVSSKMLKGMADHEGFVYNETLTGFKWLGNLAEEYTKRGYHFIYAFEEAIGNMIGSICLDKDGVRAAAVFGEMASYYARVEGLTCAAKLDQLYARYGYYPTNNRYFFCYNPATMDAIFAAIRNGGEYPQTCGPYKIKNVRDLTTGYDTTQPDNKAILPVSRSTHMITFYFENGCIATLRGSGTEPKLKYYVELPGNWNNREQVKAELDAVVANIIEHFLQPERNGLEKAAD
jgi:phosphomannomutase